jgi:putative transposase
MYLSGISTRKIAGVTDALSKVKVGKDAVSRIASPLEGEQKEWRERPLKGKSYPYLCLDATYPKVRWGARVMSMALLACVGVDEEGFREVLAIEFTGSEKGTAPIPYVPWRKALSRVEHTPDQKAHPIASD